jgi:hypothetical protein
MSISYPTSPMWKNPVTRTLAFDTGIITGKSGHEQRWMRSPGGVESFLLPYTGLTLAGRDTLLSTAESAKGSYDQTVSLVFDGNTYSGMHLDLDTFPFTESSPLVWGGTVKLSTVARAADSGSMPSDFPALSTGAITQLPSTPTRTFDTSSVRTEGARYSYAKRASGLRVWTAGGTAITKTEAQAIWDMFRLAGGRWRSFNFPDPDSGVVYTARFAADSCQWVYSGLNAHSLVVSIQQIP